MSQVQPGSTNLSKPTFGYVTELPLGKSSPSENGVTIIEK